MLIAHHTSPVDHWNDEQADPCKMARRLLTPARVLGFHVISSVESVMALRILRVISSAVSVRMMRDLGSAADLDIFCVGSRRERILLAGARSRAAIRSMWGKILEGEL